MICQHLFSYLGSFSGLLKFKNINYSRVLHAKLNKNDKFSTKIPFWGLNIDLCTDDQSLIPLLQESPKVKMLIFSTII
jgi:hypothetical protein